MNLSRMRLNQVPVESPDGSRTVFTLPRNEEYITSKISVFVNGNMKRKDVEWQEYPADNSKIEFIGTLSSSPLTSEEKITFNYIKK